MPEIDWRQWLAEGAQEPQQHTDKANSVHSVHSVHQHSKSGTSGGRDVNAGTMPVDKTDKTDKTPEPAVEPWADAYQERLALMLEDGGADEAQARAVAYEEALVAWFQSNPLPEPKPGHCARCGFAMGPQDADREGFRYFYRDGPYTDPLPVHGKCIQLLQLERRRDAERALARAGIRAV